MGQSFFHATNTKSAAEFNGHVVYDSVSNLFYKPFLNNDSLCIEEFRLNGKDTVHRRVEKVSYIIGSGQHTNSHICSFNGYLFQAPITFYTQKRKWDLAPGFADGHNSRFSRVIGMECMTCHNALPDLVKGSVNKYNTVPLGIDCERCHGPGEIHVRQKQAGISVDTSKLIDYSIVNPRKLPRDLQMSLCQRCHLQGLAVLKNGKDFDDFKPGMHLSDVWDVFLPETDESRSKFIMASQAERLRLSKCYRSSEMSCITCHHPHVSVKETPVEMFNRKCQGCHSDDDTCTEKIESRKEKNDNCTRCHMPKSGSIDIPHVYITDHFIRKNSVQPASDTSEISKVKSYLKLKCFTQERPSAQTMAKAYLSFYEKFSPRDYLLDSAQVYLFKKNKTTMPEDVIHYYYLRKNYSGVIAEGNRMPMDSIRDAWTLYRIGEAHYALGNHLPAYHYFKRAAAIQPLVPDFQNKLGASLSQTGKSDEAKAVFENILREQPAFEPAWSNLGYLLMMEGNFAQAEECYDKALALNPDYEQALVNKAALFLALKEFSKAKQLASRIMKINPENIQAKMLMELQNKK